MACEDLAREALEPCPFCGNDGNGPIEDALHVRHEEHEWRPDSWSVQCDKCTANMGYSDSPDEAVADWNRRARTDDAIGSGVKALEWVEEVPGAWWVADAYRIETGDIEEFFVRVCKPQSRSFRTIACKPSLEEAKAAAQADFERRVLSCLSTHTAAEAGPVTTPIELDGDRERRMAYYAAERARILGAGPVGEAVEDLQDEQAAVRFYRDNPRAALFDLNRRLADRPVEETAEVERLTRERDAAIDRAEEADGFRIANAMARENAETALAETRERLEKAEAALRKIVSPEGWFSPSPRSIARAALTGDAQEAVK